MNGYKTHNDKEIECCGSSLMGEIDCKYTDILLSFGLTGDTDGNKVDAEWTILFNDGVIATLYNWKDGKNYNGSLGFDVEDIYDWHIGGFKKESVDKITEVIEDIKHLGYIKIINSKELTKTKKQLIKLGFYCAFPRYRRYPLELVLAYFPKYKNRSCTIMYNDVTNKEITQENLFSFDFDSLLFEALL